MEGQLHQWFCILALGISFHFTAAAETKRNINLKTYTCKAADETYEILHVKAKLQSSDDIIHYLWTTIDLPTVVTAHTTDISAKPVVEWSSNCTQYNISFKPEISSLSAFALTSVFEYEDKDDDQDATKNFVRDVMPSLKWQLKSNSSSSGSAIAKFEGSWLSARIGFELKAFGAKDYDDDLPHEIVSENSTRFTISLLNLPVQTKKSRYAVELAFLKPKSKKSPTYKTSKSIDDEHTPGIFKLWRLSVPVYGKKMFASWKPVAYNNPSRNHDAQTFSHNFPKKEEGSLALNATCPKTIMNSLQNPSNLQAYAVKVSFGQNKDEFYKKTNFSSWTGLVGYGDAPEPEISTKVYIILSVGLGLPIALSLFGSLILVIKRAKFGKRASYEQIN